MLSAPHHGICVLLKIWFAKAFVGSEIPVIFVYVINILVVNLISYAKTKGLFGIAFGRFESEFENLEANFGVW